MVELDRRATGENQSLAESVGETRALLWGFLAGGVLTALLVAWMMGRSIGGRLDRVVDAMRDIADGEGDLTRRLEVSGGDELAKLSAAFNHFVDKIAPTVSDVPEAVSRLSGAAGSMTAVSEQALAGTERQEQLTGAVANSTVQLLSSAAEVQGMAEQSSESMRSAQQAAANGEGMLGTTRESLGKLAGDVEQAAPLCQDTCRLPELG